MNLMLLDDAVAELSLPLRDQRAVHIRDVLRMKPGDRFDVGALNGPRGKARILSDGQDGMKLGIEWGALPRAAAQLRLVIGLSRPQTMRKVLREAPALGIAELHIARCMRSEAAYASSSLWSGGERRELLRLGAEQAFTTRIPTLAMHGSLEEALAAAESPNRVALDNYEATQPLARWKPATGGFTTLCVGPERGWEGAERDILRQRGYELAHLGPRVLRTETAVTVGSALVCATSGEWDGAEG
jgi:RsmE family RNA methyltransferase